MSQQEQIANQLLPVIRQIQLKRYSGTLMVQRGKETTLERGSITFVKGQIMQARTDRRTGSEALNALSTWRNCAYRFTPTSSSDNSMQSIETPAPNVSEQSRSSTASPYDRGEHRHTSPSPSMLEGVAPGVPYRTRQMNEAMQMMNQHGFSRTHRHLFLLVDGQRSIIELAHMLKHDKREVDKLLSDLENAALIRIPDTTSHEEER